MSKATEVVDVRIDRWMFCCLTRNCLTRNVREIWKISFISPTVYHYFGDIWETMQKTAWFQSFSIREIDFSLYSSLDTQSVIEALTQAHTNIELSRKIKIINIF